MNQFENQIAIYPSFLLKVLKVCLSPEYKGMLSDVMADESLRYSEVIEILAIRIDGARQHIYSDHVRELVKKGSKGFTPLSLFESKFVCLLKELRKNKKAAPLSEEEAMRLFLRGLTHEDIKKGTKKNGPR
jgi:hypothetical protein